jgi:SAM-dependent methyltransferase
MRSRNEILAEINADVPSDIDWHKGALDFVATWSSTLGVDVAERFFLTTPLQPFSEKTRWSLQQATAYLHNFVNTLALMDLPRGARVLDVACGGGWVSHYLARLGYNRFGFDISSDFVSLARRRVAQDQYLASEPRFEVHNIEIDRLPLELAGTFDAAILESCLHHFVDPISALTHIREVLQPDGIVVIIEGENRRGPIRTEWIEEMRLFRCLERPYPRNLLIEVLQTAGLLPSNL